MCSYAQQSLAVNDIFPRLSESEDENDDSCYDDSDDEHTEDDENLQWKMDR
jgi:hypothetical protein